MDRQEHVKQRRWVNVVEGKEVWRNNLGRLFVSKNKLRYIPPMEEEGKLVVHVKLSSFVNVHKIFEKMVIEGFMGRRPPFLFVKEAVERVWRIKNGFTMKPYGDRCFLFEFNSNEDRERVLETRCFHIASQLFVVKPWHLFVEMELEDMKTIPIWVIFKKFPMELWDEEGFSLVASVIGNPLFTDRLVEERKRTSYARICVEIDTNCKYPKLLR